jgi:alpha-1,2-mannosyltransferase
MAALGVVALVALGLFVNYQVAPHMGAFADLLGRLANLRQLESTGNIYVPVTKEAFTYPPAAILFFWPVLWLPASLLTLAWTFVSLAALTIAFAVVLNRLGIRDQRVTWAAACWAAVGSTMVFAPVMECLTWGQVGTILLAMVAADYLAVKGQAKGVLVGVAAAVKIYPILFIFVWIARRQWRAAITAIVSGALTTALAWSLWPASALSFVTKGIFGGTEMGHSRAGTAPVSSSSISAFFTRFPFHADTLNDAGVAAVSMIVIGIGLVAAQRLWRRDLEVSAMVMVMVVGVIGSPIAWDHYFVFAPLMALMALEIGLGSRLGRTVLVSTVVMAVPWFVFRRLAWGPWWVPACSFVARNALLLAALAVVVAALIDEPVEQVPHYEQWSKESSDVRSLLSPQ